MKRLIHMARCLSLLLTGQALLYAQDLRFANGCDFGTVHEKDGKVSRNFTFLNESRDTVVVCGITTACRCITGEPSFIPVPPGKEGQVTLTLDPAYRSGPMKYSVVIWYHDRKVHQTVPVTADVVPMLHPVDEDHPYSFGSGLYTSHKVLPFGTLAPGESRSMFFRYANGTSEPMELRFEVEGCCSRHIEMEKVLELKPDERGKLYVTLTMPEGYGGSHVNRIWPVVNGVRLETPITVKVTTRNTAE